MNEMIRKLDRAAIRALAEKHMAELKAVAMEGGNPHQRSLDQQDRIDEYVATMTHEEAATFQSMYADELNACSAHVKFEAEAFVAQSQSLKPDPDFSLGVKVLIWIVAFIVATWFFFTYLKRG